MLKICVVLGLVMSSVNCFAADLNIQSVASVSLAGTGLNVHMGDAPAIQAAASKLTSKCESLGGTINLKSVGCISDVDVKGEAVAAGCMGKCSF
jgi:hypothetical protein